MADGPVSGFTEDTTPATTDELMTVKDPGGTPLSRRVKISNFLSSVLTSVANTWTGAQTFNAGITVGGNLIADDITPAATDLSVEAQSLTLGTPRTDASSKSGHLYVPHYTNAEQPLMGFFGSVNTGDSYVSFGGGSSLANSAMRLRFYTAGDEVTVTGTERVRISQTGYTVIRPGGIDTDGTAALDLAAATTSYASLRMRSGTAPSAPNAGDMWYDGTDLKFVDGASTNNVPLTNKTNKFTKAVTFSGNNSQFDIEDIITPRTWRFEATGGRFSVVQVGSAEQFHIQTGGDTGIAKKLYPFKGDSTTAIQICDTDTNPIINVDSTNDVVTTYGSQVISGGDNGAAAADYLSVERNSNGATPSAGYVGLDDLNGTERFVWPDATGVLRIHTAAPTNATDTAGTVVGAQTSNLSYKNIVGDTGHVEDALTDIIEAVEGMKRFTYKDGSFGGQEFDGIILDNDAQEGLARYGMDAEDYYSSAGKSLNVVNAIADLMKVVVAQNERINELEHAIRS